MKKSFKGMFISSALIVAVLVLTVVPPFQVARANPLTGMSAVLSTLKINTDANQQIMFTTPIGLASGETIILTWDSDFDTTGVVYTDLDLSFDETPDANCAAGETEMAIVDGAPVTT